MSITRVSVAAAFALVVSATIAAPPEPLRLSMVQVSPDTVVVNAQAIPGTAFYADSFRFSAVPSSVSIVKVDRPKGKWLSHAGAPEREYLPGRTQLLVQLGGRVAGANLTVTAQGCSEANICFPEVKASVSLIGGAR